MAIADTGYGIPDRAADMQQLQQAANTSGNALADFAGAAFGHLLQATQDNDANLARVWQTARRSLTQRANGNQNRLTDIGNVLAGALGTTATANKAQLANVLSDVGFFPTDEGKAPAASTLPGGGGGGPPAGPPVCYANGLAVVQDGIAMYPPLYDVPAIPGTQGSYIVYYHCADQRIGVDLATTGNPAQWPAGAWKQLAVPNIVAPNTICQWIHANLQSLNAKGVQLCAGVQVAPPQPPQPIGTPPPPPPPPPPPNICNWYCVQFGTQAKPDIRCLYSTPESIAAACLTIQAGPFPDELTCIHNCRQCGLAAPPATIPPAATPAPPGNLPAISEPANVTCTLTSAGALPAIGTAEWCACLDQVTQWLNGLGNSVIGFLIGNPAETAATSGFFSGLLNILAGQSIIGIASSAIDNAVSEIRNTVGEIWDTIKGAVSNTGLCNPTLILGVSLAKSAITALHRARIGTDAVVWLTIDISIAVEPLEKVIDYIMDYVCPTEIPSVGEAMECYRQHTAPLAQIRCWMLLRGANPDVWLPIIDAKREKLHDRELIEWIRRNNGTEDQQVLALLNQGWNRPEEASARVQLYDELPTIADHLHWLQRNVFDDAYVQDYNLLDGFLDRFWSKFGHDLRARGMKQDYAALHYAAHWILPAPTQMQQMVFRLRPDAVPANLVFTEQDYSRLLAEQDIAPYFRDRLSAIIRPVPALSYIRDMFRQSVITTDQLIGYHQDLGYTKQDSERFAAVDEIMKRRQRTTQAHGWTPAALAKASQTGYLPEQSITDHMLYLGYTAEEAKDLMQRADADLQATAFMRARSRILSGTVTQIRQSLQVGNLTPAQGQGILQSLGFPADFAASIVALESAGAHTRRIRQAVQRVRSAFHDGEIDSTFAGNSLAALGITPDATVSYLAIWQVEQTPRRKRRTAQQIVADVSTQAISIADALFRLTNLGYDDADQRLFLNDARNKVIANQAKMAASEQKIINTTARELAAIAREAERQRKEAIALLEREESPAQLDKWASGGLIDQAYHHARLSSYGWDDEAISLHWRSACGKKNANCVPSTPKSQSSPASGSSGS